MKTERGTSLVLVDQGEPRTTSLLVAEGTDNSHAVVMKLIRKYENDLKEFGSLSFENQVKRQDGRGGQVGEVAHLNEGQTTFLITCMRNNEIVINFKKRLVKDFIRVKKLLQQKHNSDFQQARLEGKPFRRALTDELQTFVGYATEQGSKNAERYYANVTKMVYKALGIVDQALPGSPLRDYLDCSQLFDVAAAEKVCRQAFAEGMRVGMPYKEIYVFAKKRVEAFIAVYRPEPLKLAA